MTKICFVPPQNVNLCCNFGPKMNPFSPTTTYFDQIDPPLMSYLTFYAKVLYYILNKIDFCKKYTKSKNSNFATGFWTRPLRIVTIR